MTTKTTLRRLALGAILAGGIWLGLTACDGAAHADDGTQQPGGVLGAVVEVVDRALPEPTKAAEPEPEPTREPEPAREPEQDAEQAPADEEPAADDSGDNEPEPEAPPANPIGDAIEDVKGGLEQVVEPVKEVVEVVTDPLPTPPVVVIPPPPAVVIPTPTPTAEPTQPATAPAIVDSTEPADELPELPAVEAPDVDQVDLPVVGPVAGSNTLLPGLTPIPTASSGQGPERDPERAPECTETRTLGDVRTDARKVVDQQQRTGHRADPGGPGKPCPAPAPPTDRVMNAAAGPGHVGANGEQYAATTGGLIWPVLARLQQLRARGDIPAGRSTHVEPGPA